MQAYGALKVRGSSASLEQPLFDFADLTRLMGFEEVWDFEKRQCTSHIAGELLKQRTGAFQHVNSGKLHAVAVAVSSAQGVKSLPEVPTFMESGVANFEVRSTGIEAD